MQLRAIPVPPGKASEQAMTDIERVVGMLDARGVSTRLIRADGDNTYIGKLATAFPLVGVPNRRPLGSVPAQRRDNGDAQNDHGSECGRFPARRRSNGFEAPRVS